MPEDRSALYFQFFLEVGIIEQISRTFLEARLPDGLIQPHFSVVSHLVRVGDGATPLELARAFQVPKTTMTHTLAGLEKHGYVQMRPNPDDKRSKRVWLTQAGRDFRLEAIHKLEPLFQEMAQALPPERIEQALPVLEDMRVFIDELRNTRD